MATRTVGVFFFERFELLDVCGPVEMLAGKADSFKIRLLGPHTGLAGSSVGPDIVARFMPDDVWETPERIDIVLVPGGMGTRTEVGNQRLLEAVRKKASAAEYVTSVCTGAAVLAKAGILDGKRATSNKWAFAWVKEQGPNTIWVPQARWVVDGNVITSGGVAAGMDMALGLVALLYGEERAARFASGLEYDWHKDAGWDPFARARGLV